MIVDLNLKDWRVVVIGAGKEAVGKIESLVSENCKVTVVAEKIADAIRLMSVGKKIEMRVARVEDGAFLREFEGLTMVMAITDDNRLNRSIVDMARKMGCLVYSVDDPTYSDFSYPAAINLYDTIRIAISTGGKSPLMARKIRESVEPVLKNHVKPEDALQVQLQGRVREVARHKLSTPESRKKFLYDIYANEEIRQLLSQGKIDVAEALAMGILDQFEPIDERNRGF